MGLVWTTEQITAVINPKDAAADIQAIRFHLISRFHPKRAALLGLTIAAAKSRPGARLEPAACALIIPIKQPLTSSPYCPSLSVDPLANIARVTAARKSLGRNPREPPSVYAHNVVNPSAAKFRTRYQSFVT